MSKFVFHYVFFPFFMSNVAVFAEDNTKCWYPSRQLQGSTRNYSMSEMLQTCGLPRTMEESIIFAVKKLENKVSSLVKLTDLLQKGLDIHNCTFVALQKTNVLQEEDIDDIKMSAKLLLEDIRDQQVQIDILRNSVIDQGEKIDATCLALNEQLRKKLKKNKKHNRSSPKRATKRLRWIIAQDRK